MERRVVPPEYADFLARSGGSNMYGEPNFILFWGQTRTEPTGIGEMLTGHGIPAWMLAMWHPPSDYGSPVTWDWSSGPYPYRGRYEIIQPFYRKGLNGKTEHIPLNFRSLELMLPVITKHRHDSWQKRRELMAAEHDKEQKELEDRIADRLQDAFPIGTGAVSFAGQTNKNSAVQQKMELIERNLGRIRPTGKGLQQARI